jgi:hypothetical protein
VYRGDTVKVFVGRPEGKTPHGRLDIDWRIILK